MKIAMLFKKGYDALEQALRETNCEIVRCGWQETINLDGIDAVLVHAEEALTHLQAMRALKRNKPPGRRVPMIAIDRDAPWHKGVKPWRIWLAQRLALFDVYATHSLQGADRFASVALYFPNAADITRYNLGGHTLEDMRPLAWYRYDVSFLGNLNAERYREHAPRVAFIQQLGSRLSGLGISHFFQHSEHMPVTEQVDIIQHSRINLNYGAACDNGPARSWGLPERCYGIPACGGFLLSDDREHAVRDFVPGAEWVSFAGLDDCVQKIVYYLEHQAEAREIAERAHRRVMHDHTYATRAAALIDVIRQWHAGHAGTENVQ